MILVPSIRDINPHGLIGFPIQPVSLLVLVLQFEMQAEREKDNQSRQSAPDGVSFNIEGTVSQFSILFQKLAFHWKNSPV